MIDYGLCSELGLGATGLCAKKCSVCEAFMQGSDVAVASTQEGNALHMTTNGVWIMLAVHAMQFVSVRVCVCVCCRRLAFRSTLNIQPVPWTRERPVGHSTHEVCNIVRGT